MTIRKSSAATALVIALLVIPLALSEFIGTIKYVYPQWKGFGENFYAAYLAFLYFLFTLIFYVIFTVVRLVQRRWMEVVTLVTVPILSVAALTRVEESNYRAAWRFNINRNDYLSAIAANLSPPPKYQVFDWGDWGGNFGDPLSLEAIVYDETDEIARNQESRSAEWVSRRSVEATADLWVSKPAAYPCTRHTKSLGAHFYLITDRCG
jgi:hypothetical protein